MPLLLHSLYSLHFCLQLLLKDRCKTSLFLKKIIVWNKWKTALFHRLVLFVLKTIQKCFNDGFSHFFYLVKTRRIVSHADVHKNLSIQHESTAEQLQFASQQLQNTSEQLLLSTHQLESSQSAFNALYFKYSTLLERNRVASLRRFASLVLQNKLAVLRNAFNLLYRYTSNSVLDSVERETNQLISQLKSAYSTIEQYRRDEPVTSTQLSCVTAQLSGAMAQLQDTTVQLNATTEELGSTKVQLECTAEHLHVTEARLEILETLVSEKETNGRHAG